MPEASERDDLHALQPGAQEVSLPALGNCRSCADLTREDGLTSR